MAPSQTNLDIKAALDQLADACGLSGESGTEYLFRVLVDVMEHIGVSGASVIVESHKDGLCYDMNSLMADAIEEVLAHRMKTCGSA